MTELLPCPFCGGEADISDEGLGTEPERYWVFCANSRCFVEGTPAFTTEAEAIEAWNTRHDRTCKIYRISSTRDIRKCSLCGKHMYFSNPFARENLNYCPNCGARAVS